MESGFEGNNARGREEKLDVYGVVQIRDEKMSPDKGSLFGKERTD